MNGLWVGALLSLAVSLGVIGLLRHSRLALRLADHPNERSLHHAPVPRVGGLGILAGALPLLFLQDQVSIRLVGAVTCLLALVSLADDLRALPVGIRLWAHLAGAALVVAAVGPPASALGSLHVVLPWIAIAGIAWMTNLFNFMDGSDGLAGGMAAIGFGVLAWAAADANEAALFAACAALSVASLGFLAFNFPPARVFMGDAGSIPLGFLAGSLGWLGSVQGAWPWWFAVVVFSPFILDASLTLLIRALRRESLFRAHRFHAYQRLVLGGWSHRRLLLVAWPLMGCAGAIALAARKVQPESATAIILIWLVVASALVLFARWHCGRVSQRAP